MNKENLEQVKLEIDRLLSYIYDTQDKLNDTKVKAEEGLIINGKPFGQETIEKDLQQLKMVEEKLINVRNHCNQKIELIEKSNVTKVNSMEGK